MTVTKSCFGCIHLIQNTENDGWYFVKKYKCKAHPKNAHLRQFPFKTTKCQKYEPLKETPTE